VRAHPATVPIAVALAVLAVAAGAAAGCGGARPPDLFVLQRTGGGAGARVALVVNDGGTVRCNGGSPRLLPSELLLEARDLARAIAPDFKRNLHLAPGPMTVFSYALRGPDGTIAFSDGSPSVPPELDRVAFFARRVSRGVCGLAR